MVPVPIKDRERRLAAQRAAMQRKRDRDRNPGPGRPPKNATRGRAGGARQPRAAQPQCPPPPVPEGPRGEPPDVAAARKVMWEIFVGIRPIEQAQQVAAGKAYIDTANFVDQQAEQETRTKFYDELSADLADLNSQQNQGSA